MPSTFPPSRDGDLLSMASNASTKITATPTAFGLTPGQATSLAAAVTSYTSALGASSDPTTRTKAKIAAKDASKASLVQNLRDLNRFVQATKSVTDEQKIEIQFPVYASRTPIPAPSGQPAVTAENIGPWRMMAHMREPNSTRRGFPAGVKSAFLFMYAGSGPLPTDVSQWTFLGSTSKPDLEVALNPAIPAGSTIHLTACWVNPRQQPGLLAPAISIQVMGGIGGSAGNAATTQTELREAA